MTVHKATLLLYYLFDVPAYAALLEWTSDCVISYLQNHARVIYYGLFTNTTLECIV